MQDNLLAAIDTFYDCVGDTFDLQRSAKALSLAIDDTGILFSQYLPMRGDSKTLVQHNFPEEEMEELIKGQFDINAHKLFRYLDAFPEATPIFRRSYAEDKEHFNTRIYQDALRPWHVHSEGVNIVRRNGMDTLSCWFQRYPGQAELEVDELSQLSMMSRQLARAIELQDRIDRLGKTVSHFNQALDLLDFGLVLYNQTDKPNFINQTAMGILNEYDGIRYARQGIELFEQQAHRDFYYLLSGLQSPIIPMHLRAGRYIKAHRPSGKPPLSIMLLPMVERKALGLHNTSVAVMIFDPLNRPITSGKMLKNSYGLTQAETALALALMQGCDVQDYADERGVSINTVRSQLRALFAKTDTTRQGELISLLLRSCTGVISGR